MEIISTINLCSKVPISLEHQIEIEKNKTTASAISRAIYALTTY